jgi:SOS-response transcriptional repressor LexA
MQVSGDAMVGAGIFNGDVVIVDRSVKAASGKVVIATLNGEMLIRRLEKTFNKIRLVPETTRLSPIDVDLSAIGIFDLGSGDVCDTCLIGGSRGRAGIGRDGGAEGVK